MAWTDPTQFIANDIPTSTGAESKNINIKVIDKLIQLHNYLVGLDAELYILTASTGNAFAIKLADSSGDIGQAFNILNSGGTSVVAIDSKGQLRGGLLDAAVIAAHFAGDAAVATKVQNVRQMAPYTFKATELAMACDDTMGVGASGTLTMVSLQNGTAFGTVRITPGNNSASTILPTVRTITKNDILTYNITAIGGGASPGRDMDHQIRGYRTGTLTFG